MYFHFRHPSLSLIQSVLSKHLVKGGHTSPEHVTHHSLMQKLGSILKQEEEKIVGWVHKVDVWATHGQKYLKFLEKEDWTSEEVQEQVIQLFRDAFVKSNKTQQQTKEAIKEINGAFSQKSNRSINHIEDCLSLYVNLIKAVEALDFKKIVEIYDELKFSTCDIGWGLTIVTWAVYYLLLHKKPKYVVQQNNTDFVYQLPPTQNNRLKVGLIADWGTGTPEAKVVLEALFQQKPDIIFHLGDIYYSATHRECAHNFFDIIQQLRKKYNLHIPVYNLAGNHDYYSGGHAFYDFNKELNKDIDTGNIQEASFFTVVNDKWQFQAMDTGFYDHDPIKKPITHLHDSEVAWHQAQIEEGIRQQRKIVLLSHHQYFSALDRIQTKEVMNAGGKNVNPHLQEYFDSYIRNGNIAAWFWGHSHVLEIYEPFVGLEFGRCIGHGAVPVLLSDDDYKPKGSPNQWGELIEGTELPDNGEVCDHGFAILDLDGDNGVVTYYSLPGAIGEVPSNLTINYREII